MLGQICKLEINGEKFEIKVNVGTMLDAERQSGKSFMSLVKSVEKGEIENVAILLGSCLTRSGEEEGVGISYIRDMDFYTFQQLFEPLLDSIIAAFPQSDKKKQTVKITAMSKKR